MEEEEIILVPLSRNQLDIMKLGLANAYAFDEGEEKYREHYKEIKDTWKHITNCLEGKEGLCKEEIRELYECMCNTYDPFPEHIQKLYEEKLKRWIQ